MHALTVPVPAQPPQVVIWARVFWLELARTASLPPCLQPRSLCCSPSPASHGTAARIAFPLPDFDLVTSPRGRSDSVPVALYVKSQSLTMHSDPPPQLPILPAPPLGPLSKLFQCRTAPIMQNFIATPFPVPPLSHLVSIY